MQHLPPVSAPMSAPPPLARLHPLPGLLGPFELLGLLGLLGLSALLPATAQAQGETIQRCESADGRVTYSNESCPPGTRVVRRFDTSPPVIVHDPAVPPDATPNGTERAPSLPATPAPPAPSPAAAAPAPPGDAAAPGAAADKPPKRKARPARPPKREPRAPTATPAPQPGSAAAEPPPAAAPTPTARIERSTSSAPARTPEQDREAASEARKRRVDACDGLVRRIEFARRDAAVAPPAERASAELAIRRLEERHVTECAPPR